MELVQSLVVSYFPPKNYSFISMKKNYGVKYTWGKNYMGQNNLGQNICGAKHLWGKTCMGQNMYGAKHLWGKTYVGQK